MANELRNPELARRAALKHEKMLKIYNDFSKTMFEHLIGGECLYYPVVKSDNSFQIFGCDLQQTFKFTHCDDSNEFIGLVVFQRKVIESWLPIFTLFFDERGNSYTSESLTHASGLIGEKDTAKTAIDQVAAAVIESLSLKRVCKLINDVSDRHYKETDV